MECEGGKKGGAKGRYDGPFRLERVTLEPQNSETMRLKP